MKKKTPTLSIITICYNIKDEIERTCESIVNQTWQDFEWIVVDGGSTDGTVDVLKKYQDRMSVFISEKDKGVYNAMNKGIKLAHGEWLNFMNGGDRFIDENVLEKVFANKEYDADVLYGWQYFEKRKYWRKFIPEYNKQFACSNTLGHQAEFIKKKCFDKYGLYDESFKIAADHEKNVCFLDKGLHFEYLPYGIAGFAEDGVSSSAKCQKQVIDEWNKIYKKYYSFSEVLQYGREYCINKNGLIYYIYKLFHKQNDHTSKIPILLSSDNNYAPFMYITMLSILKNAKSTTFYDFYLMIPGEFSKKNKKHIMSLMKKYRCDIHFINMKNQFKNIKMRIQHITSPTYYRLLAASYLKQYDKCIYLDVDLCVQCDLTDFYSIDIDSFYVAGVKAPGFAWVSQKTKDNLGVEIKDYINAGVLLMNLAKIRQDNMEKTFLDLIPNDYICQDQDVLNVACNGKVKTLSMSYNFMTQYEHLWDKIIETNFFERDDVINAIKNPKIVHYASKIKPWNDKKSYFANVWWSYAKQSPYYERVLFCRPKQVKKWLLFGFIPLLSVEEL